MKVPKELVLQVSRYFLFFSLLAFSPFASAQHRYTISGEESEVVYAMEHPAHSWTGTSKAATGYVLLDETMNPEEIEIVIPVLSFDSGNRNRDSHMAETVESYIFKNVTFRSNKISVSEPPAGETGVLWTVEGDLTFHGVTKPLTTTVRVEQSPDLLDAKGSFALTLTDYEIELPSLLMMKVKDWIKLDFDLRAHPSSNS